MAFYWTGGIVVKICSFLYMIELKHTSYLFFSMKHFGQLSHSCIKTRPKSVF